MEISLATLRAFVSEEALNELSRLAAQYSDVNCTPEDIRLYLDRIARGTPVAASAASMSTTILNSISSRCAKKAGHCCAEDSVRSLLRLGPEGEAIMQKLSQTEELAKMLADAPAAMTLTPSRSAGHGRAGLSTWPGWIELYAALESRGVQWPRKKRSCRCWTKRRSGSWSTSSLPRAWRWMTR